MTRWTIHLTVRDALGKVKTESLGAHPLSELPDALELAMQLAERARAGIQVVRDRAMPGLALNRSP
ncbi:MAG: hypothetical protein ACRDHO_16805 [Actinomycetota bacterium]